MPGTADSPGAPTPAPPQPAPQTVVKIVQSGAWLRWLPLVLALLLGLWLGYKWGARKLDAVRAELAAIKGADDKAKQEYDITTERLKTQGAEIAAQHKASVEKIEANFADERRQLQASLDRTEERLAQARSKASDASAELAKVRQQLGTAGSRDKEALRQREAQLVDLKRRLELAAKGVDCLRAPVPAEELGILNQQRGH